MTNSVQLLHQNVYEQLKEHQKNMTNYC